MGFQSPRATNRDGPPDPEVLRLAADQGRILVSHGENSMPGHFATIWRAGAQSGRPDRATENPGRSKEPLRNYFFD